MASKCYNCGAFQKRWQNWLPTIGAIFAILAFVGSAGAFVLATATDFFTKITWKDELRVISFSDGQSLVALNTGSGDLFIEHISVKNKKFDYRSSMLIGKIVRKNSFVSWNAGSTPGFSFLQEITDDELNEILERGSPDIDIRFFSNGHPQLAVVKEYLGENLRTFPSDCDITFHSVAERAVFTEKFSCEGVLVRPDLGTELPSSEFWARIIPAETPPSAEQLNP